jgi:hypothetical protein
LEFESLYIISLLPFFPGSYLVPFLAAADNSLLLSLPLLTIKGKSSFAKNLKYKKARI